MDILGRIVVCVGFGITAATASAQPLPFPDGRYVTDPEICRMSEDEMLTHHGDRISTMVRVIEGSKLNNAYEMFCTVGEVRIRGDDVQFQANCEQEGESETVNGRYTRLTPTSFRLGNRIFAHCPVLKKGQFEDVAGPEAMVACYDVLRVRAETAHELRAMRLTRIMRAAA